MRWLIALAVGFALSSVVVPAGAEPADEASARRLFAEGNARFDERDFAAAFEKFSAAYAAWKNPKILPNIGTAAIQLGRFVDAAEAYDRFLLESGADDPQRAEVQAALGQTLKQVGSIELRLSDRAARVMLDGRMLEPAKLAELVRVTPGEHTLVAELADGRRSTATVRVAAGAVVTARLVIPAPGPSAAKTAEIRTPPAPDRLRPELERPGSVAPWVAGGIGLVGLAASAVFFSLRTSAEDDLEARCIETVCSDADQSTIDRANTFGTLAVASLGIGIAGIGTAGILWLTSGRDDGTADAPVGRVRAAPGGFAVAVSGAF